MNQSEQNAFRYARLKERRALADSLVIAKDAKGRNVYRHDADEILAAFDAETKRMLIEQVKKDRASKLERRAKKVAIKQGLSEHQIERFEASLDHKATRVRTNAARIQDHFHRKGRR